jgi:hypothetical protein
MGGDARGAGGPPIEGGYDKGYGGGLVTSSHRAAPLPPRARTPVNELDDKSRNLESSSSIHQQPRPRALRMPI